MKPSTLLRSAFCIAAVAAALCAGSAYGQELLQNGSFESSTNNLDFTGWTLSNPNDQYAQNIGFDIAFSNNNVGAHANLAGDPGPDTLSQTFNTLAGTTYTFSFFLAHDIFQNADNNFDVLWNGVSVVSFTNLGTQGYVPYSFDLTATGPTSTIAFVYRDADDFFRLDDVSVQAAVPEASTMSYALIGVALLWFGRRGLRAARR